MKLIPLFALCGTFILAGCSGLTQQEPYAVTPLPAPVYTPGELNRESLYELLSAEIAGQQGMFPEALEGYLKQAQLTGDAGVAERATRIAQYMRKPDAVLEASQLWIRTAPETAEPYLISASVLLHQGKYDEALPLLKEALENSQAQTLALIDTRVAQMPAEAAEAYLALITTSLKNAPKSADLHRTQGVLLRKLGSDDKALMAFNRAEKLAPQQLEILVQKADLQRAKGDTKAALKTVKKGLKKHPDNRQLRLISIQLQFDNGQAAPATQQALKLIEENSRDNQLHLYLALLMLDAEQLAEAEKVLVDLLKSNPSDTTPEYYLGHLAQKQDKQQSAIDHYLAVNGGPKLFPAFNRVSLLLDSAEHQQRLQQIVADGRAQFPQIAMQLYVLEAEWLHLYDLTDTALAILEDALAEFPDSTGLLYTRAMLIESSDFPQAEVDLRQILTLEPDNSLALNALGYLLSIYTERFDEAYALVSKALSLNPEDAATLDSMGWVLHKLERSDEAVNYLEAAYYKLPEPEVIGHLVEVYYALGQSERARRLLQEGLEKNPDSTELQDVAERLGLN